jgi:hypothetical protein
MPQGLARAAVAAVENAAATRVHALSARLETSCSPINLAFTIQ